MNGSLRVLTGSRTHRSLNPDALTDVNFAAQPQVGQVFIWNTDDHLAPVMTSKIQEVEEYDLGSAKLVIFMTKHTRYSLRIPTQGVDTGPARV